MKRSAASLISALRTAGGMVMLGVTTLTAAWRIGKPPNRSLAQRLQAFSSLSLPLRQPVQVYWNQHQVPFIEASDDRDLAVTLGAVHAHLRLAQIEFMRRIAEGRLSEAFGPVALDLDYALRLLDVGRAVPAIAAGLPEQTREWLSGFAEGLNAVIAQGRERPYDLAILGIDPRPWTVDDLLRVARLAASDFTWRVWLRLIRLRQRPDWQPLWRRLFGKVAAPAPSFAAGGGDLDFLLGALGHGSNSLAISARRSASGGAMIASDPHLSVTLPNLWLIAGYKSPGHHAVGLMIPGVPLIALGRNPWIAWGGTNLHAASSDLIDVGSLPPSSITTRVERIPVRWSRDHEVILREAPCGPIISDARLFGVPPDKPLALRWIGHQPTDEIGAMLAVGRARSWQEYLSALEGFAIPGQNLVYADVDGRVGQVMAAQLPSRPPATPDDLVEPLTALKHWDRIVNVRDLPSRFDPPEGFVASANDAPEKAAVAVGFFFSPDNRVKRLRELLGGDTPLSRADLTAVQNDIKVPAAAALATALLHLVEVQTPPLPVVDALRGWDGTFPVDSRGALAFELIVCHFIRALHGAHNLDVYLATWDPWTLLHEDLEHADRDRLRRAASLAIKRAQPTFAALGCWGNAHRLRPAHAFGAAPVIGRRFRFGDLPAAGSNETLMKTAHGFSGGRHSVQYGANARHISDLADPDANWFVLLGGQDGWLGSESFLDQLPLWQDRRMIHMPLRPEAVRSVFTCVTALLPAPRDMD